MYYTLTTHPCHVAYRTAQNRCDDNSGSIYTVVQITWHYKVFNKGLCQNSNIYFCCEGKTTLVLPICDYLQTMQRAVHHQVSPYVTIVT